MFQGFTDATFEFFMAIRFNNNSEFFHDNHDWYVESVRRPLLELSADLSETIRKIDPELERRPEKTVSRLNRDVRFSKDKSPYRDYMWIGYHNPENKHGLPGFYVDISDDGVGYGMGFYEENKPLMDVHREILLSRPDVFRRALAESRTELAPHAARYKRLKVPDGVPADLREWYLIRNIGYSGYITDGSLIRSPELTQFLISELNKLKPMYQYFRHLAQAAQ